MNITRSAKKVAASMVAVAATAFGCGYYVVGDSRTSQVLVECEPFGCDGSVQPGCGYTGHSGYPFPCTIPLGTPAAGQPVILTVSIWDVGAPDLTAYTEYHDYYTSFGGPVVWVEAPEQDTIDTTTQTVLWSAQDAADLNQQVAAELGCTLVDDEGTTRMPFGEDGIHYTQDSARRVGIAFSELTADDACVP